MKWMEIISESSLLATVHGAYLVILMIVQALVFLQHKAIMIHDEPGSHSHFYILCIMSNQNSVIFSPSEKCQEL